MNRFPDDMSEALLAAAHKLLAEDGPDALTVRRIAGEANVSTMNVYSRFGGRDGVIDQLHADGFRRLLDAIEAVPVTGDGVEDLIEVARAYRAFAIANPTYYRLMFQSQVRGYTAPTTTAAVTMGDRLRFGSRVERAQQLGQIGSHKPNDANDIATWLWATWHGQISLELEGIGNEFIDWEAMYEPWIRNAIEGLRPTSAAYSGH